MEIALSVKELAELAGYTQQQIRNIDRKLPEDKKLLKKVSGAKYDLATFVQRWVDYITARLEARMGADLESVKAQHEAVKMRKTELQVAEMEGTMVDVREVRRAWGDVIYSASQNLQRLPFRLAPRLLMMDNQEEIHAILADEIRMTLNDIADTPLPAAHRRRTEADDGEEDEEE